MYTGSNWDHGSIEQSRLHIGGRARRAIDDQLRKLEEHTRTDPEDRFGAVRYQMSLACLYANEADFAQAAAWAERAMTTCGPRPRELRANLEALLGVIHLRKGELENCLECRGPSSCILPIEPAAVHQKPAGSLEAIRRLTAYLEVRPEDIGVRWLLNLAYMTVGEYPSAVPEKFLIPIDRWQSKLDVGWFENIAPLVGLGTRGPNMAGGSIFDDFTGDGLPDVSTNVNSEVFVGELAVLKKIVALGS